MFGVPLYITAEELVLASSAVSAMRIVSHSGGVKAPTTSFVITFDKCKEVPKYVKFGYLSFRTKLFIPRPIHCCTCQAFGHSSHYCRKTTQTCPTCAGSHSYDACPDKSAPKCLNCGGPHSVGYSGCPVYTKAQAVTKLVITTGMSYRDAVVKIKATPVVGAPLQLPVAQSPMEVVDLSGPPLQMQMIPHPLCIWQL